METRKHPHWEAWSKGKLGARRHRSNPRISGRSASIYKMRTPCVTSPCSTSRSTASSEVAPHQSAGARRDTRKPDALTRDGRVAKDAAACAVRTDRACTHSHGSLNREGRPEAGRLPLSEPAAQLPACLHPAVREGCRALGSRSRPRSVRLWYALQAAHEGDVDLQAYEELRAVQLLLGHSKLESTVWYLGIEVDDALEISEQTEI